MKAPAKNEDEKQLDEAFARAERNADTGTESVYPMEVMTWDKHEERWGEHQALLKTSPECDRFHLLIQELQWRDPTDEEVEWLLRHEGTCETGRHSDERLEKDLGLPPDALRDGAPEHGLLPPDVFASHIRRELARKSGKKRLRLAKPKK